MRQQTLHIVRPEGRSAPDSGRRSLALQQIERFPELRYMGSKRRLLPWIHEVLETLDFETALDPFSGSNSVGYPENAGALFNSLILTPDLAGATGPVV